ncbi:MAG: hypothetical protein GX767_07945 [Firmicutes bacterium]|nr:hypothetical protein [Bacillota bacterium]
MNELKVPDLTAYPLEAAAAELKKRNVPFSIEKTAPPKCNNTIAKEQFRVVRQINDVDNVRLTVAQENWFPRNCRKYS